MNIHEFLISPADSSRRTGPHDRIVMSSRVRLARNLAGLAFPGWAKKPERIKALETIQPHVASLPQLADAYTASMDELTALDKQILVERHLISGEHAA
jgi:protein arginine kinase